MAYLSPQIGPLSASQPGQARNKSKLPGFLGRLNWPFLFNVALLVALGLVVVYSAVSHDAETYSFSRQAVTVALGIIVMLIVWHFDYRRLEHMMVILLVINVVLILSPHLPVIGVESKGAQSWIKIGMTVQPGEFAKVTVLLLAASVVAKYEGRLDDPREYIKALIILAIPFLCIMTQPDLGTGLVYLFIDATALVVGGARPKFLLMTIGVGVVAIIALLALDEVLKYETASGGTEYRILKNYQRNRILVFLDPSADTSNSGYNLRQAQIAIGSGGFLGKGFGNGTQTGLNYLPEAPTDFIFCVLAEEFGFVGAMVLLALYLGLIYQSFRIAQGASSLFGSLIVMCVVGMWLFQILENIGMDCGLMPITGIPLPFVSYGSSFMLVNFVMLGLIGSVWSHSAGVGKKSVYEVAC